MNNFNPFLSDVHCSLVLDLEYSRTDAMIVKPVSSPSQLQRFWNEEIRFKYGEHLGARNFAEIRSCFEDELQTLGAVNRINGVLTGILLYSAKSVGALNGRRNPAFHRRNNWFDFECHNQRTIYHRTIREANKMSNHSEKKTAAKDYTMILLRKKSTWESKTNELLGQKKNSNPKENCFFFQNTCTKRKQYFNLKVRNIRTFQKPERCLEVFKCLR